MRRIIVALGATALLSVPAVARAGTLPSDHPANAHASVAGPGAVKRGPSGIAYLPGLLNLQPTPSGTWVDSALQVTLPRAGTYSLDADVRGRLAGVPPINAFIVARLWNVTSGTVVPNSARIITQLADLSDAGAAALNTTAPISERISVGGPTTIRLQGVRFNASGATTVAEIRSDASGLTSLRFEQTGP
ncbi:MAG TPA: hypothetical protein VFU43_16840 [Streptosporangiaceae bacterium]|nr:hypothetical protein [Streptosporangiaceae bacterium]